MITTSKSVPVPPKADRDRLIGTSEMINRMAADLRARSDTDLPHSFYVEQIRRQLAGEAKAANRNSSTDFRGQHAVMPLPSVFHAWALSE